MNQPAGNQPPGGLRIGLIGGTGMRLPGELRQRLSTATPYGEASAAPVVAGVGEHELVYLPRHGDPHRLPPHCINYRANLWALQQAGVSAVLAINAVGAMGDGMGAGSLVVPDQLVDYTWGREHSYSDGGDTGLLHIEFGQPFHPLVRKAILAAAQKSGLALIDGGNYAATQGPRLETAAEIRRLMRDGCDLVGMTGMPEAGLAAELGLPYASLCMVSNRAAGLEDEAISLEAIHAILDQTRAMVEALLPGILSELARRLA